MRKYIVQQPLRFAGILMLTAAAGLSASMMPGTAAAREPRLRNAAQSAQDFSTAAPVRPSRGERAGYDRVYNRPGELKAAPDYMPIGRTILAPTGFLEMCARSPGDCAHSAAYDANMIRGEARKALVRKYDIAFGRAPRNDDIQTAAITDSDPRPAAVDEAPLYIHWNMQGRTLVQAEQIRAVAPVTGAPTLLPAASTASQWAGPRAMAAIDSQPGAISGDAPTPVRYLNWRNKAAAVSPDVTQTAVVTILPAETAVAEPAVSLEQAPYDRQVYRASLITRAQSPDRPDSLDRPARAEAVDYDRIPVNDTMMRAIRVINNDVNRTIRSESDASIYHKADYWAAPGLMRGARGDCEDFALEKRRQLIENGFPAGALSIAIVITPRGLEHAVLLVSTTEGDLVLDNMQYDVRPWQRVDYTWVSRQAPGQTLDWVSLTPANGLGSDRQLRTTRVAYAR